MGRICSLLRAPPAVSASHPFSLQAFFWAGAAPRLSSLCSAELPPPSRPPSLPALPPAPGPISSRSRALPVSTTNAVFLGRVTHICLGWEPGIPGQVSALTQPCGFMGNLITASLIISLVEKLGGRRASGCCLLVMFAWQGQRLLKKHPLLP